MRVRVAATLAAHVMKVILQIPSQAPENRGSPEVDQIFPSFSAFLARGLIIARDSVPLVDRAAIFITSHALCFSTSSVERGEELLVIR